VTLRGETTTKQRERTCKRAAIPSLWLAWLILPLLLLSTSLAIPLQANAHGFNANRVHIVRVPASGMYRVLIYYTHVEVGEYREAHIDFAKRTDALKVYYDLINGADFFLGDTKETVHFHKEPAKNAPY
jgi:hypothetical protein